MCFLFSIERCARVHWHLPYKWQVLDKDGVTWNDLANMEDIEKAFCDPKHDTHCTGPVAGTRRSFDLLYNLRYIKGEIEQKHDCLVDIGQKWSHCGCVLIHLCLSVYVSSLSLAESVNFLTMTFGTSPVRRLSTASSVSKPPHYALTTEWLWYWKGDDGKWQEFRQVIGSHFLSPILNCAFLFTTFPTFPTFPRLLALTVLSLYRATVTQKPLLAQKPWRIFTWQT